MSKVKTYITIVIMVIFLLFIKTLKIPISEDNSVENNQNTQVLTEEELDETDMYENYNI